MTELLKPTFLVLYLFCLSAVAIDEDTCDWESRSNFYAIRAILENKMRANSSLLYELAGVFSNKQRPLKQVIVHYKVFIPVSDCSTALDCDLQYPLSDNSPDCPNGYHCVSADFIWGRYPATAQDTVFRDLDVCPLVIGDYEQRQITIYFTFENPPSCNASSVNDAIIAKEELPCGWQCNVRRKRLPSSGYPNRPLFRSSDAESPLDRALLIVATKLLQYSTDKEALPSLQYDLGDTIGYATKVGDATYFHPVFEYVLFLSAYLLFQFVVGMVIYHQRNEIYKRIFEYATKNPTQCALFWSGIATFFISCFNVTIIFFIEGGACVTLLQLYIGIASLTVPLCYFIFVFTIKKKTGFLKPFNARIGSRVDHVIQGLVMWLLFTFPHIVILIAYLASVSFFHNANSTAFLGVYIALSTVTLWIANAIFIFLVFPYLCICCRQQCSSRNDCWSTFKRIMFATCLALSMNLMNFSVMPFVGDFYYDERADGALILTIIPVVITIAGWYKSGDLVEKFSFSFPEHNPNQKSNKVASKEKKPSSGGIEDTDGGDDQRIGELRIGIEDDASIRRRNNTPPDSNGGVSGADRVRNALIDIIDVVVFRRQQSSSAHPIEEEKEYPMQEGLRSSPGCIQQSHNVVHQTTL